MKWPFYRNINIIAMNPALKVDLNGVEPLAPLGSRPNGNTEIRSVATPAKKKRSNGCIHWFMTWNNYPDDWKFLIGSIGSKFSKYIVQTEIGENGTKHLQGHFTCIKKSRWESFALPRQIHWEPTRNVNAAEEYCKKGETFSGERISKGFPQPIKLIEPNYLWEQEILEIISSEPDDRKIYWYWESVGNAGKTSFSKYLSVKHGAVPIEGKKNDILFCASNFESDLYIYSISRSCENFVSYDSLEKIKDGYYMVGKYESKPITRNPPHLFVFANFPPHQEKMSIDRWVIKEINMEIERTKMNFDALPFAPQCKPE